VSDYLVLTGMSGAGRSTAAAALEDAGWYVIDNMPPSLIEDASKVLSGRDGGHERVALVVGRGGGADVGAVLPALDALRQAGHRVRLVFLDAPDEVLVRRFEGTRRRHPVARRNVGESIAAERELLSAVRDQADLVVDTGALNVNELRTRMIALFAEGAPRAGLSVVVVSFGYSHGLPLDADVVLDCRFVPNPHWVDELRPLTGLDEPVRRFVVGQPAAQAFLGRLDELFELLLPEYAREGKSYLTVAMGCTGGRHRSVALAEELADRLRRQGVEPVVFHRDLRR
jgi:UPF0042 nucleotide-binding protein